MSEEDYKIAYENVMIANKMLEQEIERLQKRIDELEKFWRGEMKQKIYQTLDIVRGDKK